MAGVVISFGPFLRTFEAPRKPCPKQRYSGKHKVKSNPADRIKIKLSEIPARPDSAYSRTFLGPGIARSRTLPKKEAGPCPATSVCPPDCSHDMENKYLVQALIPL